MDSRSANNEANDFVKISVIVGGDVRLKDDDDESKWICNLRFEAFERGN